MIWMMMVVVLVAVPHWLNMKANFVFRKGFFQHINYKNFLWQNYY
jgi:hypothetical protein